MKIKLIALLVLCCLLTFHLANAQMISFNLNHITCNKTTEEGQDEVYFLTNFKYNHPNGNQGMLRSGPFNINDGNSHDK